MLILFKIVAEEFIEGVREIIDVVDVYIPIANPQKSSGINLETK